MASATRNSSKSIATITRQQQSTNSEMKTMKLLLANCLLLCLAAASVECLSFNQRAMFAASRRSSPAADDDDSGSHPFARLGLNHEASEDSSAVVMGKFKAPAPERIFKQRIPKSSESGSQTVGASYRIADAASLPEKVVHGIVGGSASGSQQSNKKRANQQQHTVTAKMQVSDEGLNYPPSKLSADIYGNVAEIVTAPPEAVESDFLVPASSRFFGNRRSN